MVNISKMLNKKFFVNLSQRIFEAEQQNLLICISILIIGILFGSMAGVFFTIALIIFSLWRSELALVLIFFSGFLKNIEILRNLPVDLTIFAVILLAVHSLIKITKTRKFTKLRFFDILVALQGLLVLFSVVFISSRNWLNWWDAGRFIVFNLSLYFGLFLLSVKRKEIINITKWILFGVLVITSSSVHNLIFGKITSWHLSSFGESYTILGLVIGLGIIFLFLYIFSSNQKSTQKIFSFVLYGLLIFIFAFIPSRHVLLSLTLTLLLIILLKNLLRHRLRLIGVLIFSLIFYLMGLYIANIQGVDVKRSWSYKGKYAVSFSDRRYYLKSAIELFKENPIFGIGMGEFIYLHGGKGNYPHNLLIESLVSFGIFSIFIFWPTFLISFKNSISILRDKNMKNVEVIALWFIFFFFDSNFSGSLSNFRILWLFMGILSILHYANKTFHSK